jgi:ribonuclease BN (tRNA processing enzyme)
MTPRSLACLVVVMAGVAGAAGAAPAPPPLELLVVGSGGPRAFGRAGTSYLVLVDGAPRILVDAGPGAFLEIGKLGVDLGRVDTVLLTHLHIDHSGDLPALFLARALTSDGPIRFAVFGPQGSAEFPATSQLVHLLFDAGGAWPYQRTFGADEDIHAEDLATDLAAPERRIVATDDGVVVRATATHHGNCPSIAYRVDYKGASITFAGDMDASALPNLVRLARDTDLLVFHLGVLDPPGSPELLYTLHTAPRQLGEAARDARAGRVLLGHIAPAIERAQREVVRSIGTSYRGRMDLARDGKRVAARRSP